MMDFVCIPEIRKKNLISDTKKIKELEDLINVKIRVENEVFIESEDALAILRAKEVIKAFGRGFDFDTSLLLLDESYSLEIIDISNYAKKSKDRMKELKGRIIGTKGKTKNILEKLSESKIAVYGKTVSLIAKWDMIQDLSEAIHMILTGSKQGAAYYFLEEKIKNRFAKK